jgi:hypothetical protein
MSFSTDMGKAVTFSISNAIQNPSLAAVQNAMDVMISRQVFAFDLLQKLGASTSQVITNEIF